MAILETPPNSNAAPPSPDRREPPPEDPQPVKVRAGKYGELEQHELVRLLDSFDDERSRGRFRESIYVSIFVYLALAWLILFGPRVLFHQGQLINIKDAKHDKNLTELNMPKDLTKLAPPRVAPKLDRKTLDQLQAMRRAADAKRPPAPTPAPTPLPATPQPQPQPQPKQPTQQTQQPPPPTPTPQPIRPVQPQNPAVPDAPKPNFAVNNNPGQAIRDAAKAATSQGGGGGQRGDSRPLGRQGAGASSGAEILSATLGVDFGPYLKRLLAMVKASWYPLIPEECYPPLSKEGTTLIRFTIQPNGVISAMHLDDSTHDRAIDHAAWGSITGIGQFAPLPAEFKGPNLELRIQFVISRNPPDAN